MKRLILIGNPTTFGLAYQSGGHLIDLLGDATYRLENCPQESISYIELPSVLDKFSDYDVFMGLKRWILAFEKEFQAIREPG